MTEIRVTEQKSHGYFWFQIDYDPDEHQALLRWCKSNKITTLEFKLPHIKQRLVIRYF